MAGPSGSVAAAARPPRTPPATGWGAASLHPSERGTPTSMTAAPDRLRSSADVRRTFAEGHRGHAAAVTAHARRRDDAGRPRAAVVASRKVGPAVVRNRAKRRLRAVLSSVGLAAGLDVVLVAKPPAATMPFFQLREQVAGALRTATMRSARAR